MRGQPDEHGINLITGRTIRIIEDFLRDQSIPFEFYRPVIFLSFTGAFRVRTLLILQPENGYSERESLWIRESLIHRIGRETQVIRLKDSAYN